MLIASSGVSAQPRPHPLKIGVVNLSRLIQDSPQAEQAKANMTEKFAGRKKALETESDHLAKQIDKLQAASAATNSSGSDDDTADKLQSLVRDEQRKLQMEQSQYNDDVADAEQKELASMRKDIRQVIDSYAKSHGYDLILGDSVLYSTQAVDVTDEILGELKNAPSTSR